MEKDDQLALVIRADRSACSIDVLVR
jgi:hypothetical protein